MAVDSVLNLTVDWNNAEDVAWNSTRGTIHIGGRFHQDAPAVGDVVRLIDLDPSAGWLYGRVIELRRAPRPDRPYNWIGTAECFWSTLVPWPESYRIVEMAPANGRNAE